MQSVDDARRLLGECADFISVSARNSGVRAGLPISEIPDFQSWAFVRLAERDCRLVRKFRRDGPVTAYFRKVVTNLARDYRTHLWGKWRPSARARRRGAVHVEAERLITRDGFQHSQASRMLIERYPGLSSAKIERALRDAPQRRDRRTVRLDPQHAGATDTSAEQPMHLAERVRLAAVLRRTIEAAVDELPAFDRRLLVARFSDGQSVAAIARQTEVSQRRLYSRLERILESLRTACLDAGLDDRSVFEAVAARELDLSDLFPATESPSAVPLTGQGTTVNGESDDDRMSLSGANTLAPGKRGSA